MEINCGLWEIAVSFSQRWRVLGFFFVDLGDFRFDLLLSWLDSLEFGFNLVLTWRWSDDFCELLSMLDLSSRLVFHFEQNFPLEHLVDILFSLLLVIFAQVFINIFNQLLLLLALLGQNLNLFWLWSLMLDENWSYSWLNQRGSGMVKNWSVQSTGILLFFQILGFFKLLLDSLERFHWVLNFSLIMLSLQLIKLLLFLFGLLFIYFGLFSFKLCDTHRVDADGLFLNCWHCLLSVFFGVCDCSDVWPISYFLPVHHS